MTLAIEARGLGRQYRGRWALADCTLSIPVGRIVGLVGPNGAGKSTLLNLACGRLRPTTGSIRVLGGHPGAGRGQLARVGFVPQDTPTYARLSVADHLRLGAAMNPAWDREEAHRRVEQIGLDPRQRAGSLSGGQCAQLALALAAAKRPELLLLDEPVAALDPVARRAFLDEVAQLTKQREDRTVVLSSHVITDLERICDHLLLIAAGRVRLAGPTRDLLGDHHRITGARRTADSLPSGLTVVQESHTARISTFVVRAGEPLPPGDWHTEPVDLEDLVLAYLSTDEPGIAPRTTGGVR
ncbi:ABC transporter ATP-binding protein [Kitasatospora cinereorecta]|uniref:ABC transporter ATP-binding protein n=1 Tax=Kitasatospora cinereorecta TaxID=285560 RepID=A0ABW0VEP8_9ACTN